MGERRTFTVCQGCGAWKETGGDLMSFFSDYDMRFFVEQHMARCPVTGKSEILKCVGEDDPDYQPLPVEKQWRSESCPGYKPPQEPKFEKYTAEIHERLVGVWVTDNPGGHSDEVLMLLPDGSGALDFYNVVFCGRRPLQWRVEGQEQIHLVGSDGYFRSEKSFFEVGRFTNTYGDVTDIVRIYDRGRERRSTEFLRSKQSLLDYEIPEEDSGR